MDVLRSVNAGPPPISIVAVVAEQGPVTAARYRSVRHLHGRADD